MSDRIVLASQSPFCAEEVGEDDRVYIKKEKLNDELVWAIYSPEGEQMARTCSREMALAIIRQNDLTAAQVH